MRFSRLRLNGFKSFVDPTELVIADGLTGVVGPNGCGKSNLLEALRWVMGETRPTAMRGGGMEDVIFAGAASRPARAFAEVALGLDDPERRAPPGIGQGGDALEVVRRITREAGSAYRVDGREVRARDVQMLFADASTGAHSPALVRQGQIAELINAKPERRRRVLEEAAGISGLYQRRHEAELKLNATEANLARVEDVVTALAGRIAGLARQARQAARYREIGTALRLAEGRLLWRRWREADDARAAAADALAARRSETAVAERASQAAEAALAQAAAALPPLREEATVAAALQEREQVARATLDQEEAAARAAIGRLEAALSRLEADARREAGLDADARASLERLEAEAADLASAMAGQEDAVADARAAAEAAGRALRRSEDAQSEAVETHAALVARHRSVTRARDEAEARLARLEAAALEAARRAEAAEAGLSEAEAERAEAERAGDGLRDALRSAETAQARAEADREASQDAEAQARAARASAEGEAGTLSAELRATEALLARDGDVAGTLLDRVEVEDGFEAAFGAALGEAVRAPEDAEAPVGWVALDAFDATRPLPEGVTPLAAHVTAPDVLGRALSQIGLVEDGAALQAALGPGQVLVSKAGDLWRWDGYRAAAGAAPSAAARRLQQQNRLAGLRRDHTAAEAAAAEARVAHVAAVARLDAARATDGAARDAFRTADRAASEAERRATRAQGARDLAETRLEAAREALAGQARDRDEARAARDTAVRDAAALAPMDGAQAALDAARADLAQARADAMARRAEADTAARDAAARVTRAEAVEREAARWRDRLSGAGARVAEIEGRRDAVARELEGARAVPAEIAARRAALTDRVEAVAARRAAADAALRAGETAERDAAAAAKEAERGAGAAREARAAAQARADAAGEGVAEAVSAIRDARDATPEGLLAALGDSPEAVPGREALEREIAALRRQRDGLGAVNLRAEEDAAEARAEHETLAAEMADLEQAVAELRAGIASLNREGRQRLRDAFEVVNANFAQLFTHLFRGGEARLELVASDDPLEAGLEIMCQPPGKKLSTLSLLSGGEQTLTALALIFAVFLANPAPICVLDEVDAPLDDANVGRFCDMLDEMTRRTETRFLIITHHAVTMARMDRLFGVTMAEQGVSQLVSVDLTAAESLVA